MQFMSGCIQLQESTASSVEEKHAFRNMITDGMQDITMLAGYKYVRLYDNGQACKLYVEQKASRRYTCSQGNISAVNVEKPDLEKHPLFAEAEYLHTVMGPGSVLYIPARCWHFVTSLSTSISVNFWF
jgi:[protein]-arginine 3-hydroxylase / protease